MVDRAAADRRGGIEGGESEAMIAEILVGGGNDYQRRFLYIVSELNLDEAMADLTWLVQLAHSHVPSNPGGWRFHAAHPDVCGRVEQPERLAAPRASVAPIGAPNSRRQKTAALRCWRPFVSRLGGRLDGPSLTRMSRFDAALFYLESTAGVLAEILEKSSYRTVKRVGFGEFSENGRSCLVMSGAQVTKVLVNYRIALKIHLRTLAGCSLSELFLRSVSKFLHGEKAQLRSGAAAACDHCGSLVRVCNTSATNR